MKTLAKVPRPDRQQQKPAGASRVWTENVVYPTKYIAMDKIGLHCHLNAPNISVGPSWIEGIGGQSRLQMHLSKASLPAQKILK